MSRLTTIVVEYDFFSDHLAELPADGNRYELVDGLLLVSPAPVERHQCVLSELSHLMRASVRVGRLVYFAPLDVRLSDRVQVQSDLLVVLNRLPLLCVELLSPSIRQHDVMLTRRACERAGIASYWILDPAVPSLVALALQDGAHVGIARVEGAGKSGRPRRRTP